MHGHKGFTVWSRSPCSPVRSSGTLPPHKDVFRDHPKLQVGMGSRRRGLRWRPEPCIRSPWPRSEISCFPTYQKKTCLYAFVRTSFWGRSPTESAICDTKEWFLRLLDASNRFLVRFWVYIHIGDRFGGLQGLDPGMTFFSRKKKSYVTQK